ncbi:MAG: cation-transporting P-type ATPase [Actinomycetia bacterium]|nr:cation-transporting P-type ATPase [Actinomycetes bacterium]
MGAPSSEPSIPTTLAPWQVSASEVLAQVGASDQGLTEAEVQRRRAAHGFNRLPSPKRRGPLVRLLLQFHNVLIYVLLVAAVVTAMVGDVLDTAVIAGVVVINALIGFTQEGKAEKALESIRNMLSPQAQVLRDARRVSIPAEELVPGDIVFLQSGDKVAADLRLLRVKDLRLDESILTGESVPVEKSVDPVDLAAAVGDRNCIAHSGTLVTYGLGTGVVVATGEATEIGQISRMLAEVQTLVTPLLRQMAVFARWLSAAIVVMALATFAFGFLVRSYGVVDMFMAAVSLAVAAIPEGLPAILTITLAIGVRRMAGRNAIIRRLPAVETLGSVAVICSDKTGTLTRNEMTVQTVVTADLTFEVSGVGYEPHGGFSVRGTPVPADDHPELVEMARAAMLCNDAQLHASPGGWCLEGDPTEGSLVILGHKAGLDHVREQEELPRIDVIPFESEHRFMATLHHDHTGHGFIYVKGAPETVLGLCSHERRQGEDRPLNPAFWHARVREVAAKGQRLLAVAFRDTTLRELRFSDVEGGLTLLGLVGLIDPPREEAIRAVRRCQSAGIRVKMITGDHALTAVSIGAQMGLGDGKEALTGQDLEELSDDGLRREASAVDVFARASPEHKLRLVQALQAEGHVVAMTGDGVNDAPALKRADVGVAMGVNGTEAAKEAAEMVLADDNFATIAHAVEEGRTVYDNLKKALLFILPTNGGQALVLIAAIALGFGHTLPITPVQILWVNMVVAVTLALALAFEPTEADVMRRPPRDPRKPILSGFLLWRVAFVSVLLVAGSLGMFLWEYHRAGADIEAARTVAVDTLVIAQVFYLFNARTISAPSYVWREITGNRYALLSAGLIILFQLGFTYLPPMQELFGSTGIGIAEWSRIIAVGLAVFLLVEIEKALLRRSNIGEQPRSSPGQAHAPQRGKPHTA